MNTTHDEDDRGGSMVSVNSVEKTLTELFMLTLLCIIAKPRLTLTTLAIFIAHRRLPNSEIRMELNYLILTQLKNALIKELPHQRSLANGGAP
jgi:hypothetical protein